MKNYRYTRDLQGSPEGTVRELSPDEAQPLVDSGALVETDEPTTPEPEPGPVEDRTITGASIGGTKQSVAAPKPTRQAR